MRERGALCRRQLFVFLLLFCRGNLVSSSRLPGRRYRWHNAARNSVVSGCFSFAALLFGDDSENAEKACKRGPRRGGQHLDDQDLRDLYCYSPGPPTRSSAGPTLGPFVAAPDLLEEAGEWRSDGTNSSRSSSGSASEDDEESAAPRHRSERQQRMAREVPPAAPEHLEEVGWDGRQQRQLQGPRGSIEDFEHCQEVDDGELGALQQSIIDELISHDLVWGGGDATTGQLAENHESGPSRTTRTTSTAATRRQHLPAGEAYYTRGLSREQVQQFRGQSAACSSLSRSGSTRPPPGAGGVGLRAAVGTENCSPDDVGMTVEEDEAVNLEGNNFVLSTASLWSTTTGTTAGAASRAAPPPEGARAGGGLRRGSTRGKNEDLRRNRRISYKDGMAVTKGAGTSSSSPSSDAKIIAIDSDNSCWFSAVLFQLHWQLSYVPRLRRVLKKTVFGDPSRGAAGGAGDEEGEESEQDLHTWGITLGGQIAADAHVGTGGATRTGAAAPGESTEENPRSSGSPGSVYELWLETSEAAASAGPPADSYLEELQRRRARRERRRQMRQRSSPQGGNDDVCCAAFFASAVSSATSTGGKGPLSSLREALVGGRSDSCVSSSSCAAAGAAKESPLEEEPRPKLGPRTPTTSATPPSPSQASPTRAAGNNDAEEDAADFYRLRPFKSDREAKEVLLRQTPDGLRELVADFMEDRWDDIFSEFGGDENLGPELKGGTRAAHLKQLRNPRNWAGNLEIWALTKLWPKLRVEVIVRRDHSFIHVPDEELPHHLTLPIVHQACHYEATVDPRKLVQSILPASRRTASAAASVLAALAKDDFVRTLRDATGDLMGDADNVLLDVGARSSSCEEEVVQGDQGRPSSVCRGDSGSGSYYDLVEKRNKHNGKQEQQERDHVAVAPVPVQRSFDGGEGGATTSAPPILLGRKNNSRAAAGRESRATFGLVDVPCAEKPPPGALPIPSRALPSCLQASPEPLSPAFAVASRSRASSAPRQGRGCSSSSRLLQDLLHAEMAKRGGPQTKQDRRTLRTIHRINKSKERRRGATNSSAASGSGGTAGRPEAASVSVLGRIAESPKKAGDLALSAKDEVPFGRMNGSGRRTPPPPHVVCDTPAPARSCTTLAPPHHTSSSDATVHGSSSGATTRVISTTTPGAPYTSEPRSSPRSQSPYVSASPCAAPLPGETSEEGVIRGVVESRGPSGARAADEGPNHSTSCHEDVYSRVARRCSALISGRTPSAELANGSDCDSYLHHSAAPGIEPERVVVREFGTSTPTTTADGTDTDGSWVRRFLCCSMPPAVDAWKTVEARILEDAVLLRNLLVARARQLRYAEHRDRVVAEQTYWRSIADTTATPAYFAAFGGMRTI